MTRCRAWAIWVLLETFGPGQLGSVVAEVGIVSNSDLVAGVVVVVVWFGLEWSCGGGRGSACWCLARSTWPGSLLLSPCLWAGGGGVERWSGWVILLVGSVILSVGSVIRLFGLVLVWGRAGCVLSLLRSSRWGYVFPLGAVFSASCGFWVLPWRRGKRVATSCGLFCLLFLRPWRDSMAHVAVAMRCMCCHPMGGGGSALFWQLGRGSAMGIFLANMAHGGSASRPIGSVPLSVR